MERYIAIDNVCAWPNLTLLPNGEIVATIFNQPCHGRWQGDVDCWASVDGGRMWDYRGTPAPHDPETNRMNVAAGLAGNGDLVVIASGWSNRPTQEQVERGEAIEFRDSQCLEAWVCRSDDSGNSWSLNRSFPPAPEEGMGLVIPFGDVLPRGEDAAYVSGYSGKIGTAEEDYNSCYFLKSNDNGQTWGNGTIISAGHNNETSPLHLGDGRWLAAARRISPGGTDLFRSEDDGETWQFHTALGLGMQHPAHLLRLADGKILITYGNRCRRMWGVDARISNDEGDAWSPPVKLVDLGHTDLGYPSSVQTEDQKIVTAYYAARANEHSRYHMGVMIWETEELFGK